MITITQEFLALNKSDRGGFRNAQLYILGESWPPQKGWMKRIMGKEITEEEAALFKKYATTRTTKKERKAIKASLKPKKPAQIAYEKKCGPVTVIKPVAPKQNKKPSTKILKNSKEWLFANSDSFLLSFEWRKVRMIVLKKYGARCQCCGATVADGLKMHVDHIKPRKLFPQLALSVDNLQVLCEVCNHGKGNWDMTDWRESSSIDEQFLNHLKSI